MNLRFFYRTFFLILVFCMFHATGKAQETKIIGKITDRETKEPLPFVNLLLKNTSVGTTTDFNGDFVIETKIKSDSLLVSIIGYEKKSIAVKNNRFQEFNIQLESLNLNLPEVVILPGENPAEILLKKIIKNKKKNTNRNVDYLEYEEYNKIQFDANNLTEKFQKRFKKKKLFKPFEFILQYVDTSVVNGKTYLPVFLNESFTKVYHRNNPSGNIRILEGNKISGFENRSVTELLKFLYQDTDIYSNYINIFDKNFVSPIASTGLMYYKYYLVDSAYRDEKWCYKLMFKPKRKQELTFTGNLWIADTTYAVKEVEMKVALDANINFVNSVDIKQTYSFIDNKYWMLTRDYMIADLNVIEGTKNVLGFYGHRTTTFGGFKFNVPHDDEFYNHPVEVIEKEDAFVQNNEFWEKARHEKLTKKEKGIYAMVDSIKNVPIFQTYLDVIYLVTNGYLKLGKFQLGPYHKAISFNPVEGVRFRLGGRTNKTLSKKYRITAYGAYGVKDKTYKYYLSGLYLFNKNPRRSLFLSHKYDLEQLGTSVNAFSEDNILGSIFRRSPSDKLMFDNEYSGYYEHEWFTGLSNKFHFKWQNLTPKGGTKVVVNEDNGVERMLHNLSSAQLGIETRFAYREKFVERTFERISLGTQYPILSFSYYYSFPNIFGSKYEFHKIQLGVRQWFNFLNYGWSRYIIQGGQVFGKLPYPLLALPPGNQSFIYDPFTFNLMNFFEFVTDKYVGLMYVHHFDGFFLNRIPLMRKLKWREVVTFKGIWGTLSKENLAFNQLPIGTSTLEKPYFEAGVGIENIFKVFRVDAVWRLSHLENPKANKFAVFGSLFLSF
ncbi:MAG: DUF5686 family protein [Bacteroidales bacterium]